MPSDDEILKAYMSTKSKTIIIISGLISVLMILAIKDLIRPMHLHLSDAGKFLQGTLPNFFAATGLTCIIFSSIKSLQLFPNKQNAIIIYGTSLFVFAGLTLWEFVRFWFGQIPIDYYDILMTLFGCVLTVIFLMALTKEPKQINA